MRHAVDWRRPLVTKECPVESKVFFFELGENSRGRFLRVSESGAGYITSLACSNPGRGKLLYQ